MVAPGCQPACRSVRKNPAITSVADSSPRNPQARASMPRLITPSVRFRGGPAPRLPAGQPGPAGRCAITASGTVPGERGHRHAGPGPGPGQLTAFFYGRTQITGFEPGIRIRLHGTVGIGADGHPAMINPAYELLT